MLTIEEAAKYFRVSLQTIYRWIREDQIKVKYELGYRFVSLDALQKSHDLRHPERKV